MVSPVRLVTTPMLMVFLVVDPAAGISDSSTSKISDDTVSVRVKT